MAASEQVQLMVNKVRHKKRDGTLYLMGERIAWCPEGKDLHFEVKELFADIKCQKVSPDSKAKVQLQLILLNGNSVVFHFTNSSTAKVDRESVKNLLAQMLPKFRRKIDTELEEKNKLLQVDPDLFQTYKDLVVSGVITPDEFWASHSSKLSSGASDSQNVGVSAAFLADVRPQADGCNGLRYNLNPDTIQSIFLTYPAVKRKYLDKVPDKLSEKEFWTMFFQSHYFHRDRLNQGSSKDIFTDCIKKDEQDIASLLNIGVKDIFNDLNYLEDEDSTKDEGYGSTVPSVPLAKGKQSNAQQINQNIIKRFNHQNAMILSACKKKVEPTTAQNGEGDNNDEPENKRAKLKDATLYEDLENPPEKNETPLNLKKSERYLHGPTLVNHVHRESNHQNVRQGVELVYNQCLNYKPRLAQALEPTNAASALSDLSEMTNSNQLTSNSVDHILTTQQQHELKQIYSSASELLRHFWQCFPANTPFLQEKVVRMCTSIESFHNTRVRSFQENLRRSTVHVNVTEHLEEMFKTAYSKFNSWQSKKQARK